MTQCANCGNNYRSDILAVCPQCLTSGSLNSSTAENYVSPNNIELEKNAQLSNVVECSNCGWGYRGDIFVTCPHCSTSNPYLHKLAGSNVSTGSTSEELIPQKRSGFGATFIVALFVFVIVFGLGIMTSGYKNFAFLNNFGSNQTSNNSNSGKSNESSKNTGTDSGLIVEEEPSSTSGESSDTSNNTGTDAGLIVEEEPAPEEPSGHQEERCRQDYVSGGYDQAGNYIDGEWVTVCQWVWVND